MNRLFCLLFLVAAFSPSAAVSSDCPVTLPLTAAVELPAIEDTGWFGSDALAVRLPSDGRWKGMGLHNNYRDKLWFWRRGYAARSEPRPDLVLDGATLAGALQLVHIGQATNAFEKDGNENDSGMMIGVEFPSAGCWHVTATYRPAAATQIPSFGVERSLSFVVEVVDE